MKISSRPSVAIGILAAAMGWASVAPAAETGKTGGDSPPAKFAKLRTRDGMEYLDCRVIRVEPDALVIRHRKGIARISFFHLSREIREAYRFDPFAALDHYQAETERQRAIRWRTFWDKQRHEADLAAEEDRQRMVEKAVSQWIPVEAKVIQRAGDSFLARCKRVVFVRTKKRSRLGFLVDGPPRRELVDFAAGKRILLRPVAREPGRSLPGTNATWKGYVDPLPQGESVYRYRGSRLTAPLFRAVERP